MTSLLALATDFTQASPNSSGNKLGMKLAASGLFLPASVLVDEAGNTIDGAAAALAGTERGLVTRALNQSALGAAQTGSLTATGQSVTATALAAYGNVQITVHGTYGFTTTPPTYIIEGSDDSGTTWYAISAMREDSQQMENTGNLPANTIRSWIADIGGFDQVRIRTTAWGTPSGTATVRILPGGFLFAPAPTVTPAIKTYCAFGTQAVAGTVADTMMTLTPNRGGTNGSTGTSFAVTTGKRLKIIGITISARASAAVASWTSFRLRHLPTGAAINTSPIAWASDVGAPAQVIGAADELAAVFGADGPEFTGTDQIGISSISAATTVLNSVLVYGYEY